MEAAKKKQKDKEIRPRKKVGTLPPEVKERGFKKGVSGNPAGRPKGSRNKLTLMKLVAEEAIRDENFDKMRAVADKVINDALEGNQEMMKLVWNSLVSKGPVDSNSTAKEKHEININIPKQPTKANITIEGTTEDE